jgi:5-hydroxyisourate hydrolase-like protein (transthyretin family)
MALGARPCLAQPQLYAVTGTVVNSVSGDPVRGATVALTGPADDQVQATTRSGDDGRFALRAMPAGKYRLRASHRGYTTSLYEEHENFSSAVVTGPDQDTAHMVFRLPPEALLRGVVSDDSGEPVENATVMLFRQPGKENPGEKTYQAGKTTTDDTGAYEFASLRPGEYLLAVEAVPWYALHKTAAKPADAANALDVAYPVTYYDSTTDEASAMPIAVTPGNRVQANINLHAVPALHITVDRTNDTPSGPVPTSLRQSLFGTIDSNETGAAILPNAVGETEFDGLAPGHYELTAGTPPRVMELDASSSGPVDASTGLPAAAIAGTVETAPGAPYKELALLTLIPADGATSQHDLEAGVNQGKFSLEDVPAGEWTLALMDGYGYEMQIGSVAVGRQAHAGNRLRVTGQKMELVVSASEGSQTIEGFARRDGKGVAGAMVVLVPRDLKAYPALARRDQTDSDGSFSLMNVVPGGYTVVAIDDAWELDWARPETIARYLPGGTAVTVSGKPAETIRLEGAVAVQPR